MTPANYDVDRVHKLAKDAKESELNTVEIARIIFPSWNFFTYRALIN